MLKELTPTAARLSTIRNMSLSLVLECCEVMHTCSMRWASGASSGRQHNQINTLNSCV